jgi:hypothetical protein
MVNNWADTFPQDIVVSCAWPYWTPSLQESPSTRAAAIIGSRVNGDFGLMASLERGRSLLLAGGRYYEVASLGAHGAIGDGAVRR